MGNDLEFTSVLSNVRAFDEVGSAERSNLCRASAQRTGALGYVTTGTAMRRTGASRTRARIVRRTVAATIALMIVTVAVVLLTIGSVGYFDSYCVTKPEVSGFNHIRGPSYDVLGRTVTCRYAVTMDQIANGDTTDVIFEHSFPLIGSATVLGSASILIVLVGRRVLQEPSSRPIAKTLI